MGVEMEGGKPGWNDAMNGLPGILGSGMPETYEMLRILRYVRHVVQVYDRSIYFPLEFATMINDIMVALDTYTLAVDPVAGEMIYWDDVNTARERYRLAVAVRFDGRLMKVTHNTLIGFMASIEEKTVDGIERALETTASGLSPTYFHYECTDFEVKQPDNHTHAEPADPVKIPKFPTASPMTLKPSLEPTYEPTLATTSPPTVSLTLLPSEYASEAPSEAPTEYPTARPSVTPPTEFPTEFPTAAHSHTHSHSHNEPKPPATVGDVPTASPVTKAPISAMTHAPTAMATHPPTVMHTVEPTELPTASPSTTSPTEIPSEQPTTKATRIPSASPTVRATHVPTTSTPSAAITDAPTAQTTKAPSKSPTKFPRAKDTKVPTEEPTEYPTESPTEDPTKSPTKTPTDRPTDHPTDSPTVPPTERPSGYPTDRPTEKPTKAPTEYPTEDPTESPTEDPTGLPTEHPTEHPTEQPTKIPTEKPTKEPTESPTHRPTRHPTIRPTKTANDASWDDDDDDDSASWDDDDDDDSASWDDDDDFEVTARRAQMTDRNTQNANIAEGVSVRMSEDHHSDIHTSRELLEKPIIKPNTFDRRNLPLFLEGPTRHFKSLRYKSTKKDIYDLTVASPMYDMKLKMLQVCESLAGMTQDIGRMMAFSPGWLENQSIWLHMAYKFYLELIRGGLYAEFFKEIETGLVPFMNHSVYGRSPIEASSFIVSSAFPDDKLHGEQAM
jgi:hypothetical protein